MPARPSLGARPHLTARPGHEQVRAHCVHAACSPANHSNGNWAASQQEVAPARQKDNHDHPASAVPTLRDQAHGASRHVGRLLLQLPVAVGRSACGAPANGSRTIHTPAGAAPVRSGRTHPSGALPGRHSGRPVLGLAAATGAHPRRLGGWWRLVAAGDTPRGARTQIERSHWHDLVWGIDLFGLRVRQPPAWTGYAVSVARGPVVGESVRGAVQPGCPAALS